MESMCIMYISDCVCFIATSRTNSSSVRYTTGIKKGGVAINRSVWFPIEWWYCHQPRANSAETQGGLLLAKQTFWLCCNVDSMFVFWRTIYNHTFPGHRDNCKYWSTTHVCSSNCTHLISRATPTNGTAGMERPCIMVACPIVLTCWLSFWCSYLVAYWSLHLELSLFSHIHD